MGSSRIREQTECVRVEAKEWNPEWKLSKDDEEQPQAADKTTVCIIYLCSDNTNLSLCKFALDF